LIDFGGWCGKKNTRVAFAVPDISDGLEWKKAFKKHVKKAVKTVRKRSGVKKSSGVEITVQEFFFVLNLAKLIDFVFGVEISTIQSFQVYIIHIYIYLFNYIMLYKYNYV
jgi:hypothetical protein